MIEDKKLKLSLKIDASREFFSKYRLIPNKIWFYGLVIDYDK